MKKAMRISLILIGILLIVILMCFYLKSWFSVQYGTDYMSKEEIVNILTENFDEFNNAVEILKAPENSEDYYAKITKASYNMPPFVELLFRNQIVTEAPSQLKSKTNNSSIKYILTKLDFVSITATSDYIYFTNRNSIGFSPQIVYSINDENPDNTIFESSEKITGNWYYCS